MSGVAVRGVFAPSLIPTSASRTGTTGLIAAAAGTPALSAGQPGGGAWLNSASDSTLRNVFSTHTNTTVPTMIEIHPGFEELRAADGRDPQGSHEIPALGSCA